LSIPASYVLWKAVTLTGSRLIFRLFVPGLSRINKEAVLGDTTGRLSRRSLIAELCGTAGLVVVVTRRTSRDRKC
jgi:hypothetical protein